MAKVPLILHVSTGSQALPALAYLLSKDRTRAAAYIAAGSLVSAASNLMALAWARLYGNNQVFSYISSPITLGCFLMALAEWQRTPAEGVAFRRAMIPTLAIWIVLVLFVEDMTNFDLVTGPLYSITLLVAGLWTLLRRTQETEVTPIVRTDWFWVSLGFALAGASTALASPVAALLMAQERADLAILTWKLRAGLSTIAFLTISWGIYRGPMVSKFSTAP